MSENETEPSPERAKKNETQTTEKPIEKQNSKRRFYLTLLTGIFLLIGFMYLLYWILVGRFYESTEDAYVNGNIIPITSQVDGIIIAVQTDDTRFVKEGQTLVQIDPIDAKVAFEQAKANLAQTVRSTHQYFLNNQGLMANVQVRQTSLEQTQEDLKRRTNAISYGAVSKEELTHAQDALKSAAATLNQAQASLLSNKALTDNTDLEHHPNVMEAAARLRKAYINYARTTIRAPLAGEISKRTAQVGQRVTVGTPLMAIIALEQVWVDANFKEKQLRHMRIGQPVTLTADIYGSSVEYHGTVMGFSPGTGSAFALLPAQNATGNWIKVVQRLPVRIQLKPEELAKHPLRIGLSMDVTVDTHNQSGKFVSEAINPPIYKTTIYELLEKQSNEQIAKIILENVGKTAGLNPGNTTTPKPANKKRRH